jgi:hypothetical protein
VLWALTCRQLSGGIARAHYGVRPRSIALSLCAAAGAPGGRSWAPCLAYGSSRNRGYGGGARTAGRGAHAAGECGPAGPGHTHPLSHPPSGGTWHPRSGSSRMGGGRRIFCSRGSSRREAGWKRTFKLITSQLSRGGRHERSEDEGSCMAISARAVLATGAVRFPPVHCWRQNAPDRLIHGPSRAPRAGSLFRPGRSIPRTLLRRATRRVSGELALRK